MTPFQLQILLPVHNEGESIEAIVTEMHQIISPIVPFEFIICEDGSKDNTKEVLRKLAATFPMRLILSDERKGYSRAVVDGMIESDAPYLLCLDSDGQCDPKDFAPVWKLRDSFDLVMGWRVNRADNPMRRMMSRTFYGIYQAFFHTPVHDPSCPYLLMKRPVVERIAKEMGQMQQGFWWEFVARVHRRGYTIKELPVNHRTRYAGTTQVYKLNRLPGIGYRHFLALFTIWRQTRS